MMATVSLSQHQLDGALGPILVDVRTSERGHPVPAVIVHHGFKGFKDFAFIPQLAERLARAGFCAVTLSTSGSGVDADGNFTFLDRFAAGTYSRELDDLQAVMMALTAGALAVPPPSSVGIVGHSRGGGMALCLAHETPGISAVATLAAISRVRRHSDAELAAWKESGTIEILHQRTRQHLPLHYEVVEDCLTHEHGRLDIAAAAADLGRPWLLIHGTADTSVPIAEGKALAGSANNEATEVHWLEGADHTFGTRHPWGGSTPDSDQVFDLTTRFFGRHLT